MSMYREPIRRGAFIVSVAGPHSWAVNAYVPTDVVLKPGTVLAKPEVQPDGSKLFEPFTGAVGQVVGGVLYEGVDPSQVVANGTTRRGVIENDAEVTPQGGRMTFPEGADAAATATLRAECIEGLEALTIRVR